MLFRSAFAAGNVAIALNRYCRNNAYDIVIYHSGLSEQDKRVFMKIPHCILKEYTLEEKFIEFMLESLPEECRFRTRERLMCFAHFEAFRLLEEYENVVWLDADILVREDMTGLMKLAPLAFAADRHSVGEQFIASFQCKYDLNREAIRISMMVLGDSLPYEEMYKWCYQEAWKYAAYSKNPEQAVINLCLQEFDLQPLLIPNDWQCCDPYIFEISIESRCIHFGTEHKVWNDEKLFIFYPEWYRNHAKWLKLGGSVSNDYKIAQGYPSDIFQRIMKGKKSLFRFDKVPTQSKIIIYGGGKIGHRYIEQIQEIEYCTVIAVLDKNASKVRDLPVPVLLPEELSQIVSYDYIVIALKDEKMIQEVRQKLLQIGVDEKKIVI